MYGLWRKLWRDMLGRPMRSLMTVVAIAIGVGGLVAISSTSANVAEAQKRAFDSEDRADLVYWLWGAGDGLTALLEGDARIVAAELRMAQLTKWQTPGSRWRDVELVAMRDMSAPRADPYVLLSGVPPGLGEIVLDSDGARREGVSPGDVLSVRDGNGRERQLVISGISRTPTRLSSSVTRTDLGYVPWQFVSAAYGLPGANQLLVRLVDGSEVDAVRRSIEQQLRRLRLQHAQPQVRSPEAFEGKRELDALLLIMQLFGTLGAVLGAILVGNTLSASVSEQVREIAIIKALGGRRSQVLALFVAKSLTYGLLGSILGIAFGLLAGWWLLRWIAVLGNATTQFRIVPGALALGVSVGLLVSLVGGTVPSARAARLVVAETLVGHGIASRYGEGAGERFLAGMRLPALWAMAIRGLWRRKTRTVLTVLVIALAVATYLGADAARLAVDRAIDDIYRTYNADAWCWTERQLGPAFERSLEGVPGVQAAEMWALADGAMALAPARLWGLPTASTLYREDVVEGRWFSPDAADEVVLSQDLAAAQGVRLGDWVEMFAGGQTRQVRVVGIAIDNTIFLGGTLAGKAFLPRESLSRLLGERQAYRFLALGLDSGDPARVDETLARLESAYGSVGLVGQPAYDEIEAAQQASRLLTLALVAMLLVVAVMGVLGVLNTLTLNVIERRREIGVLRALGASDVGLVAVYLVQGLTLVAMGWLAGLAMGYPLGLLLTRQLERVLFSLSLRITLLSLARSGVAALVVAVLASVMPALAAARLGIRQALRYE